MSATFGPCPLCPQNSPAKRLYGTGVCSYHLGHPEDNQSGKKHVTEKDVDEAKLLDQFYRDQWNRMPRHCENGCGARLLATTLGKAKFMIAHIVPKKIFKSVMVHPDNTLFLCWPCHQLYDQSWAKAVKLPVWPLAAQRFEGFMRLIKDTELKSLPDVLRTIIELNPPL